MPERREDGTWSWLPDDKPLMGDPPPDRSDDTLNTSELVTVMEVARLVLGGGEASNHALISYLGDQLDVSNESLIALGVRLENVLESCDQDEV